jgi:hypothetical protein
LARTFTRASAHYIQTAMGNWGAFGGSTIAVICKKASDPAAFMFLAGVGEVTDNHDWYIGILDDKTLDLWNGAVDSNSTFTVSASEGWVLLAATKTSGTTTVRLHKYVYSTNTWTHQNTAAGTSADQATSGTMNASIGSSLASGTVSGSFDGDIAVVGKWNVVLADNQLESLSTSLNAWWQAPPAVLFTLDQSATGQLVRDLTGGGANQSAIVGTTVSTSSLPVFSYGWFPTLVHAVGGAIANTISLSGATTPTGLLIKQAAKFFTGATTPTGALAKQDAKLLTGATTPTGALTKQAGKHLTGATTPTGALVRACSKFVTGAVTPTGTLIKQISKTLVGSITPAGALAVIRAILLALGGAITPAGTLVKQTSKTLTGAVGPSGALAKACARAMSGTITPAGALTKTAVKQLAGAFTPVGGLVKNIGKRLAGALGLSGALSTQSSSGGPTAPGYVTLSATLKSAVAFQVISVATAEITARLADDVQITALLRDA